MAELLKNKFSIHADLNKPRPISTAIIQRKTTDLDVGRVAFPVVIQYVYGSGGQAIVFAARDTTGRLFALRLSLNIPIEIERQMELAHHQMAPQIHYVGTIGALMFTFMDPIRDTLEKLLQYEIVSELKTALVCLLDKKTRLNLLHGDMHVQNIVLLDDGKTLGFIDFGSTFYPKSSLLTTLDFIPLILSVRDQNLRAELLQYYKDRHNMDIEVNKLVQINGGRYNGLSSYIYQKDQEQLVQNLRREFPNIQMPANGALTPFQIPCHLGYIEKYARIF